MHSLFWNWVWSCHQSGNFLFTAKTKYTYVISLILPVVFVLSVLFFVTDLGILVISIPLSVLNDLVTSMFGMSDIHNPPKEIKNCEIILVLKLYLIVIVINTIFSN